MNSSDTIYFFNNDIFSFKTYRVVNLILGIILVLNGFLSIHSNGLPPFGLISGVLLLTTGLFYLVYFSFLFKKNSSLIPNIKVDKDSIRIKKSILKPKMIIDWVEVNSIKYDSFAISFNTNNGPKLFSYVSSSNTSRQIKETIRKYAEHKDIRVLAG